MLFRHCITLVAALMMLAFGGCIGPFVKTVEPYSARGEWIGNVGTRTFYQDTDPVLVLTFQIESGSDYTTVGGDVGTQPVGKSAVLVNRNWTPRPPEGLLVGARLTIRGELREDFLHAADGQVLAPGPNKFAYRQFMLRQEKD